jgi:DNA-binding transcriptional regulator YdaS (Cro superfamily)
VDVELTPEQAPEIHAAILAAVVPGELRPDPWWQAGIDDALET